MLHITARHLKEPEDAIFVWFTGGEEEYREERNLYITKTEDEVVQWFWIDEPNVVMIRSCFDRTE
ncbi:MAG: hypothetical protein ACLGIN_10160 [Candidatus Sericytochromatia bacterium]